MTATGSSSAETQGPGAGSWDAHWQAINRRGSAFGRIASLVRLQLLGRALRHYAERYFPREGVFVEAGCGTAQSSSRLPAERRRLVGLDFSLAALGEARKVPALDATLAGDILRLPFRDRSVAGIWNLGVLEHFGEESGVAILCEMRRVLVPGGHAVLFWPPEFGSSRLVLGPLERLLTLARGRAFAFFPDEVNRLRSREHARRMLRAAGLEPAAVDFGPRDLFIHLVVVARNPA